MGVGDTPHSWMGFVHVPAMGEEATDKEARQWQWGCWAAAPEVAMSCPGPVTAGSSWLRRPGSGTALPHAKT